MLSWLAGKMIARNMKAIRAGDLEPTLAMDAEDVRFRFPGDSSWGGEVHGKEALSKWLDRFVATGLQIYPDEVVVRGWPWNTTIAIRGTDHLDVPGEGRVYENRYVIWGRIAWGLMREYEVYEDTQASRALDEYLLPREQRERHPA